MFLPPHGEQKHRKVKRERRKTRTNLLLSKGRDESGLDDEGKVGQSTLTENLAVTVGEGVDDGNEVSGRLREVLLLLGGDKGPD